MPARKDPTQAIMESAASIPDVAVGTSCNQTSYKLGKKAFLYIGPGPKGVGYKAMFKLRESLPEAETLAAAHPAAYQIGTGGWVTTRFSAEKPLLKKIWGRWLKESVRRASS